MYSYYNLFLTLLLNVITQYKNKQFILYDIYKQFY